MKKIEDREYNFHPPNQAHPTSYHIRTFQDPQGKEKPVFVINQSVDNKGASLDRVRTELATDLSKSIGKDPSQIEWHEQHRDGSMKKYDFEKITHTVNQHESDLNPKDLREHQKHLKPQEHSVFTPGKGQDVSPDKVEKLRSSLNDKLDIPKSFAERQSEDFKRLNAPREGSQLRNEAQQEAAKQRQGQQR